MNRLAALLLDAVTLAGCRVATFGGESIEASSLAMTPYGVMGTVQVADSTFRGELIAIQGDALLIETVTELIEIPARFVHVMRFPPVGVRYGNAHDVPAFVEKLRLAARHPFGVPAPAMQALLDKHQQSVPRRVTP